nr:Fic/DOC family N-terminal domain-containing protein [Dethiosulfatarculus sandiegensis]
MQRNIQGRYHTISTVGNEICRAYLPNPLPPEPQLHMGPGLQEAMGQCLFALGRLSSLSTLLPSTGLFIYMCVRKEAVLSSQIEGTQSSLSYLLLYENDE